MRYGEDEGSADDRPVSVRGNPTQQVLELLGYDPYNQALLEQMDVFLGAFRIFANRSARHTETWKDSGWRGALFDIRKKVDRLWNEFMVQPYPPEDFDSAYDAINFLGFFIRAREYGIQGVWRWPDKDSEKERQAKLESLEAELRHQRSVQDSKPRGMADHPSMGFQVVEKHSLRAVKDNPQA